MGQCSEAETKRSAQMVNALLDTSVVVDLLRAYQPAQNWFTTQASLGVCRAVWLEILEGAQNRQRQRTALQFLGRLNLVEITTNDVIWATQQLMALNLSHNIDSFDCLIGAVNHRLQVPLYTRNLKHFSPLIGNLAVKPY